MSMVEFGMFVPAFDMNVLLACLAGGAFAGAIGPLWTFIFTGFLVIGGVAMGVANPEAMGMLNEIAFGPFFGPHIAFSGGVAAACYAAKKGHYESARDIATPLIKFGDPMTMIVGAVFGAIGYVLFYLFAHVLAIPTDNIALTVAISNILARVIITGQSPLGNAPAGAQRFANIPESPWVPWQASWANALLLGLFAGGVSGFATLVTGSPVIGFGIAAASLIALIASGAGPVTHHMTLPGGLAAAAMAEAGNPGMGVAMAALWGAIGALVGEVAARLFISYGDSHIDPPAVSIAITTFLIIMLL